jgi:PAS domain S-box-containing protein
MSPQTERVALTEAQRVVTMIETADDAILSKDLLGTILSWNRAAERIYGFSAAEAIGSPIQMLQPSDRPDEMTQILERLAAGEHLEQFETRRVRKDGELIDVSLTISPMLDVDGHVVAAATIARDITGRKAAERRIRELAAIVESSHDAIVTRDNDHMIVTWNQAAERLFGYTQEEVVGRSFDLIVDDAGAQPIVQDEAIAPFDATFRAKDGTAIPASVALSPVYDEENRIRGVAGVIRDLRETRRLEEQLLQSQKLEAIGSLAGGVAHDFNNLLTIILAANELVLAGGDTSTVRARTEQIDAAAKLGAGLTAQLLAFSRQQILRPESLDLNDIVVSTMEMLDRLIGDRISVSTELPADLWPVHLDRTQLQQVIMNLAVNARDAMPGGGSLVVRTQNATLDVPSVAKHFDAGPGPHALLELTDSGSGMDDETKRRLFDPFFTTKAGGSGLGLATVYGIVRQSGGQILVDSEPGRGTTFKLYFPRAAERQAPAAAKAPVKKAARATGGTILLVEDNALLRALIAEVLESAGYEVLTATDGEDALAVAEAAALPVDLVLTDVMMPRIDGRQLAERLLARDPATRIVFTSGYPASVGIQKAIDAHGISFIQKPYGAHELVTHLEAAFDG